MAEKWISVGEFAKQTNRFPNQIYDLINKGNKFGKLKSKKVKGRTVVASSEVKNFPFNAADAVRISLEGQITKLERRVLELEDRLTAHCQREGAHGI